MRREPDHTRKDEKRSFLIAHHFYLDSIHYAFITSHYLHSHLIRLLGIEFQRVDGVMKLFLGELATPGKRL